MTLMRKHQKGKRERYRKSFRKSREGSREFVLLGKREKRVDGSADGDNDDDAAVDNKVESREKRFMSELLRKGCCMLKKADLLRRGDGSAQ
jgi:hypothetical protein